MADEKPTPASIGAETLDSGTCKSLVLLLDASSSVEGEYWTSQYISTANAITHPYVAQAIFSEGGTLAVKAMRFSGKDRQVDMTDWHAITNEAELQDFATALKHAGENVHEREFGITAIGNAIDRAGEKFSGSPCQSNEKIIDISTDGLNREGMDPKAASLNTAQKGVTINAIAVNSGRQLMEDIKLYLEENVAVNGFTRGANWKNYETILMQKLIDEVASVPPAESLSPPSTPPTPSDASRRTLPG